MPGTTTASRRRPVGATGPAGTWSVPLTVDGRRAAIAGTFWHVSPPSLLPWLLGALAVAAAVAAAAVRRPGERDALALVLAVVAAAAALVAIGAFAVRDAPTGGIQWLQLAGGAVVAAAPRRCSSHPRLPPHGRRRAWSARSPPP